MSRKPIKWHYGSVSKAFGCYEQVNRNREFFTVAKNSRAKYFSFREHLYQAEHEFRVTMNETSQGELMFELGIWDKKKFEFEMMPLKGSLKSTDDFKDVVNTLLANGYIEIVDNPVADLIRETDMQEKPGKKQICFWVDEKYHKNEEFHTFATKAERLEVEAQNSYSDRIEYGAFS